MNINYVLELEAGKGLNIKANSPFKDKNYFPESIDHELSMIEIKEATSQVN